MLYDEKETMDDRMSLMRNFLWPPWLRRISSCANWNFLSHRSGITLSDDPDVDLDIHNSFEKEFVGIWKVHRLRKHLPGHALKFDCDHDVLASRRIRLKDCSYWAAREYHQLGYDIETK